MIELSRLYRCDFSTEEFKDFIFALNYLGYIHNIDVGPIAGYYTFFIDLNQKNITDEDFLKAIEYANVDKEQVVRIEKWNFI